MLDIDLTAVGVKLLQTRMNYCNIHTPITPFGQLLNNDNECQMPKAYILEDDVNTMQSLLPRPITRTVFSLVVI